MPDRDGYPTKEELDQIRSYKIETKEDLFAFIEFLREIWWDGDDAIKWEYDNNLKEINLELHTQGWSGNEDIIEVLEKVQSASMFWIRFWYKEIRGGHYYFKINLKSVGEKNALDD